MTTQIGTETAGGKTFSFDGTEHVVPAAQLPRVSANPLVSVVLSAFKRARQLRETLLSLQGQTHRNTEIIVVEANDDGGVTRKLAMDFGAIYCQRLNWRDRRTSITNNIGIRRAHGEIVVVQSAECRHESKDSIEQLVAPIIADSTVSTFPRVLDLDEMGAVTGWKYHPETHPHCFITFCQAFARSAAMRIGAFDEEYLGWGYEDNDFNFRLQFSGVECRHVPVLLSHQWHASLAQQEPSESADYYRERIAAIRCGAQSIVANIGKAWGDPTN